MEGRTFLNITLSFWTKPYQNASKDGNSSGYKSDWSLVDHISSNNNNNNQNNQNNQNNNRNNNNDNNNNNHNNNNGNNNNNSNNNDDDCSIGVVIVGRTVGGATGGGAGNAGPVLHNDNGNDNGPANNGNGSSTATGNNMPYTGKRIAKKNALVLLFETENNNNNNNNKHQRSIEMTDNGLINKNANRIILFDRSSTVNKPRETNGTRTATASASVPTAATTSASGSTTAATATTTATSLYDDNKAKPNNALSSASVLNQHQDDSMMLLDNLSSSIRPINSTSSGGDETFPSGISAGITDNDASNGAAVAIGTNTHGHDGGTITATNLNYLNSINNGGGVGGGSWSWSNFTESNESTDWQNIFYLNNNLSNGIWNTDDCSTAGIGSQLNDACLLKANVTTANLTAQFDPIEQEHVYWALILVILPILALFGNILVILSVYRERSLQTVTNWFIVSLAFADLFVTIPMLFCTYVMVNVDWELSEVICDLYIATDVICSTASIFNLVAISFDRYIAVTHPIFYSKHKNDKRVIITIILVWMASFGVGLPIMLGANTSPERIPELCIFYNSDFIIYSSLWSFYVPCLIMVILYYKIFKAIHNRAKKKIDNLSSSSKMSGQTHTTTNTTTSNNPANNRLRPMDNVIKLNINTINDKQQQAASISPPPSSLPPLTATTTINESGKEETVMGPELPKQISPEQQDLIVKSGNVIKMEVDDSQQNNKNRSSIQNASIALISKINFIHNSNNNNNNNNRENNDKITNINDNENSNNTKSHSDDYDEDEEEDDNLEDEAEVIEIKQFQQQKRQHKCSNKLFTSDFHCSTDNINVKTIFNESNFQIKSFGTKTGKLGRNGKNRHDKKCDMFVVENAASNSGGKRADKCNNQIIEPGKDLPIKIPESSNININVNSSPSGSTSGTTTSTSKDKHNREYSMENGNDEDDDDIHDVKNGAHAELHTITTTTTTTNTTGTTTTNNNNNNNNIDNNNNGSNRNNFNNNRHNETGKYSKKKSRFNLGRKHKSSRKKREKVSARRERKATKTLAIVLGVFLLCWTPFFSCNILDAICIKLHENHFIQTDCRPGMTAFLLTTWLGYMNSCANPLIYTIFNTEFRKAFRKILCNT